MTVRILDFPAPLDDCPTEVDDERLGDHLGILAEKATPEETLALYQIGNLYVDAGAYCRTAEERLK